MSDKVSLEVANPLQALSVSVSAMAPRLQISLQGEFDTSQFIRAVMVHIQTHKDVWKIIGPKVKRPTLYLAIERAAIDGLLIDGREAALVPFGDTVVYVPMYKGLLRLARQSGEIKDVHAEIVYRGDDFQWIPGTMDHPIHRAGWFEDDRGSPVGAWAMVRLKDGGCYVSTMTARTIIGIGLRAKNNAQQYNPKTGVRWEEWWKKTVLRNVLKTAPHGRRVASVIASDDEANPMDFSAVEIDHENGIEMQGIAEEESEPLPETDPEGQLKAIMSAVDGGSTETTKEDKKHGERN